MAVNKLTNGRVCGEDFASGDVSAIVDFSNLAALAFSNQEILQTRRNSQRRLLDSDDSDVDIA